ncbi:MAG: hypothetical protein WCG06_02105, partial [Candidatus Omnitrophota bacterium]
MIRRRLLIGATAACFLLQPPAALAVEADHDFLLEIAKPDLTVQAVSVDMSLYIGWRKTDKTGMSRA